jgi:hypothetical protein
MLCVFPEVSMCDMPVSSVHVQYQTATLPGTEPELVADLMCMNTVVYIAGVTDVVQRM